MKKLYPCFMIVDPKTELPWAIGDSLEELAEQTGQSIQTLQRGFNRLKHGDMKRSSYAITWIERD